MPQLKTIALHHLVLLLGLLMLLLLGLLHVNLLLLQLMLKMLPNGIILLRWSLRWAPRIGLHHLAGH